VLKLTLASGATALGSAWRALKLNLTSGVTALGSPKYPDLRNAKLTRFAFFGASICGGAATGTEPPTRIADPHCE
jgi:hypothetical protein